MKLLSFTIGAALAASLSAAAYAAPVVLDFSGLDSANRERPTDFYNGGHGSLGGGPGPNFGITFSEDAFAECSLEFACDDPQAAQAPQDILRFLDPRAAFSPGVDPDAPTFINVQNGFTGGVSFIYANDSVTSTVRIRAGANGTGAILKELTLDRTCPDEGLCSFRMADAAFDGLGRSIEFVDFDFHLAGVDNITLNLAEGGAIPEPASWALMIAGFGLVGASLRHRKTSAAFA